MTRRDYLHGGEVGGGVLVQRAVAAGGSGQGGVHGTGTVGEAWGGGGRLERWKYLCNRIKLCVCFV